MAFALALFAVKMSARVSPPLYPRPPSPHSPSSFFSHIVVGMNDGVRSSFVVKSLKECDDRSLSPKETCHFGHFGGN